MLRVFKQIAMDLVQIPLIFICVVQCAFLFGKLLGVHPFVEWRWVAVFSPMLGSGLFVVALYGLFLVLMRAFEHGDSLPSEEPGDGRPLVVGPGAHFLQ